MTDTLNHRGAPMRGGDPLAELARIVNRDKPREEPFSDLFNEARRPDRPLTASGRPAAVPRPVDFGTDQRHDDDFDDIDLDRDDRYEVADDDTQTEPWTEEFYDEESEADAYEQEPARKRGRGLAIAAALGTLVIAGGVVYAWQVGFGSGPSSVASREPPVISAATSPSKIEVEPKATEPAAAPSAGDKVVVREETPVALGEKALGTPDSPRVVLPSPNGQPTAAAPAVAEPVIAPAPAAVAPKPPTPSTDASRPEPRRVRTVKVLADGTIVTGEAPAAPSEVPSLAQQVAPADQSAPAGPVEGMAASAATEAGKVQDAIEAKLAETVESSPPGEPSGASADPAISVNKPIPADPALSVATRGIELKGTDPSGQQDTAPLPATSEATTEPAVAEAVDLPPSRPEVPVRVASTDVAEPAPAAVKPATKRATAEAAPLANDSAASSGVQADTQIATASTPVATAPAAPSGGGFVVQIAAAKSNADAQDALKSMQRRYADVIGGKPSSIRKVDIEGKGTFYRVRIGPMATRDAATSLCVSLKAAGGDCVVARN